MYRGEIMINKSSISYDSYSELAEYYFKYVDNKPYNALYERPATLDLLPNVEGKRVLDAGCAAGWYTKWLLEQKSIPIAIDFNRDMVKYTIERVNNQCVVKQHDLNNPLDFIDDNSLDVILSSLTIHYIKDWDRLFRDFYKKLKPNGVLVFSTHHPFMDFQYFEVENYFEVKLLNDTWSSHNGTVDVQFYRRSLQDIMNPLVDAGFTIDKISEPKPVDEMKDISPKAYNKLCNNPQFLFVRAIKK